MSRKETVLIAVLVNIGLLGVLFMMATVDVVRPVEKTDVISRESDLAQSEVETISPSVKEQQSARDEIDQVLRSYAAASQESYSSPAEPELPKPFQAPSSYHPNPSKTDTEEVVEITVKRGDSLEKIARANGTTVKALMQENQLKNVRIDVGQVLKIPLKAKNDQDKKAAASVEKPSQTEQQFYTMKTGDNPWKIAKQFHVRFDELLEMNHLDEEKARNLKPGDTLRVK